MRLPTLIVLAALAGAAAPVEVGLDERFALSPGDVARVDGGRLELLFSGVLEDSRCPVDVTCVWAGDAVVALRASTGGAESSLELHTSADRSGGEALAGYRIRLLSLAPEPRADETIEADSYRAELVVSRDPPPHTTLAGRRLNF